MRSIHDILNIVILRYGHRLSGFKEVFRIYSKILTLEQMVKALEICDKNTVAETFGVSKDQMQTLVKCKAHVREEYSGNTEQHRVHTIYFYSVLSRLARTSLVRRRVVVRTGVQSL